MFGDSNAKEVLMPKKMVDIHIHGRRRNMLVVWKRSGFPKKPPQFRITLHEAKNTTTVFSERHADG